MQHVCLDKQKVHRCRIFLCFLVIIQSSLKPLVDNVSTDEFTVSKYSYPSPSKVAKQAQILGNICFSSLWGLMKRYHSPSPLPSWWWSTQTTLFLSESHDFTISVWQNGKVTCGQTEWTHRAAVKVQLMTDEAERIPILHVCTQTTHHRITIQRLTGSESLMVDTFEFPACFDNYQAEWKQLWSMEKIMSCN